MHSQPGTPSQTCTVTRGSGSIASSDVNNVAITCVTNSYTIGGVISGLTGHLLVIRYNGGDDILVGPGATSFTFGTPMLSGSTFGVIIARQPTDPSQTCTVTGGTGTVGGGNVTSIAINCGTDAFTVGGHISGPHQLGGAA